MTVAVVGANGQLGTDIAAEFQKAGVAIAPLTHVDLDISSLGYPVVGECVETRPGTATQTEVERNRTSHQAVTP